ncbi:unnamed protein product [Merluccius merluccius]
MKSRPSKLASIQSSMDKMAEMLVRPCLPFTSGKLDSPHFERGSVGLSDNSLSDDLQSVYESVYHKKFTAFTSPVGLHQYNRLPQGL